MNVHEELRESLLSTYKTDFNGRLPDFVPFDDLPSYLCNEVCVRQLRAKNRPKRDAPDLSAGPAVMYLPLGGGGGSGCPSLAETSVTSISQMTFLWTVMSVFNVVSNIVANINNNQNNNNNNNNNLQINKISTQNTQISANTNNANTISIMLPPPIPVLGRGLKIDAKKRLKRFVERERKLELRRNGTLHNAANDKQGFMLSALPIIRLMLDGDVDTDCLGRQLCHVSKDIHSLGSGTGVDYKDTVVLKTILFGLLWIKLEDRSESFVEFLDRLVSHELDQELDCDLIFYQCTS